MTSYGYDIDEITRKRLARGLMVGGLADLAGIHPTTAKNVLEGVCGTPTTVAKIAAALDIDLADITIDLDAPTPIPPSRDVEPSSACGLTPLNPPSPPEARP